MVDVHYHLLYGVDDGPKDLKASLALAEASIAEGVTHIVSTPHASYRYEFDPAANQAKLAELNQQLGGRVTLGLGCDFQLSRDNISDAFEQPAKYTINGSRYLLVEFPDVAIPPNISEVLYEFTVRGIVPIITHPERNFTIAAKPEMMKPWIRGGCLVQITAASLVGKFDSRAQSISHYLLKKQWVHLIASDAHHIVRRPPMMKPAYEALKKAYGVETAERLCLLNPRAIFDGQPLPRQPEPLDLDENKRPRRRGIFARLFKR
jgi:protein-tyrosine phosphatase